MLTRKDQEIMQIDCQTVWKIRLGNLPLLIAEREIEEGYQAGRRAFLELTGSDDEAPVMPDLEDLAEYVARFVPSHLSGFALVRWRSAFLAGWYSGVLWV